MATALSDIQTMCRQVEKLWKNEISLMLDADVDPTAIDDEEAKPEGQRTFCDYLHPG